MIALQIANKDNRILDYQHFMPGQSQHPLSTPTTLMHVGQEYRPPFYGHISLFNLTEAPDLAVRHRLRGHGRREPVSVEHRHLPLRETAGRHRLLRASLLRRRATRSRPTWAPPRLPGGRRARGAQLPRAVVAERRRRAAAGVVSRAQQRLPRAGHRRRGLDLEPAPASSWSASSRGYFQIGDQPLTWQTWMKALLAGRGFVTNGPLIEFNANGAGMGEEVDGARRRRQGDLQRHASIRSCRVDRFELVSNGKVVHTVPLDRRQAPGQLRAAARRQEPAAGTRCARSARRSDLPHREHQAAWP